MPYIVCVNQPGYLPEGEPYTVATLEEAREAALEELTRTADTMGAEPGDTLEDHVAGFADQARVLPEAGGMIGPLPDGYVIDVRRIEWAELWRIAGGDDERPCPAEGDQADILDAYNGV